MPLCKALYVSGMKTKFIGKLIIGLIIFSLGVSIGVLYKTIVGLFHTDYMKVTIVDYLDQCLVEEIEIKSGSYIVRKIAETTRSSPKTTINYYAMSGKRDQYDILVRTKNCGVLKGENREAFPGQVIYEEVGKDGIHFYIRK